MLFSMFRKLKCMPPSTWGEAHGRGSGFHDFGEALVVGAALSGDKLLDRRVDLDGGQASPATNEPVPSAGLKT